MNNIETLLNFIAFLNDGAILEQPTKQWLKTALNRYAAQPQGETVTLDKFLALTGETGQDRALTILRRKQRDYHLKKAFTLSGATISGFIKIINDFESVPLKRISTGGRNPVNEVEQHLHSAFSLSVCIPRTAPSIRYIIEN